MIMRLMAAFAVFCSLLFGQGGTGSITGSVSDSSGAVVPGVVVTATNQGNGFKRETTVTSAGEYSLGGLQPGVYTLTAGEKQFKTFSMKCATRTWMAGPHRESLLRYQLLQDSKPDSLWKRRPLHGNRPGGE